MTRLIRLIRVRIRLRFASRIAAIAVIIKYQKRRTQATMSLQRDRSLTISNIHTLLEGKHWKEADELLSTDPDCAKQIGGTFAVLPLCTAIMHSPPVWIVDSLIEAYPGEI